MGTIRRFEEIEAWQEARVLTKRVIEVSGQGEFARCFGLKDQMRRAVVSILSNIAEGFESRTRGLFVEMLGRAKGSAGEVRAQFYVAHDAGYLTQKQLEDLQDQCEKCSSQICRFMAYLQRTTGERKILERSNVATSGR